MEPFPNPNMIQSGYVNPQVNVTNGGLPDGFVGGVPRLPDILPLVPDQSYIGITGMPKMMSNVFDVIKNSKEVVVEGGNDSSHLQVVKENVRATQSIPFAHNVITIQWNFKGTEYPFRADSNLINKLRVHYTQNVPYGLESVFNAKRELYGKSLIYFQRVLSLKVLYIDHSLIQKETDEIRIENSSQPFNVFLALLRVMKGFKRKFDVTCSILVDQEDRTGLPRLFEKKPLKIDIHIIKTEGINIAIGEQIVNGKVYPFFMTSEEIKCNGKVNTYIFTNLILSENEIKDELDQGTQKYLRLRDRPWYIGKPKNGAKGINYPDIFVSNLFKWNTDRTTTLTGLNVLNARPDEPILEVPDSPFGVQQLYNTPEVELGGVKEYEGNSDIRFTFMISFPSSYYTHEMIQNQPIIMENYLEEEPISETNSTPKECPFVLRREYDMLWKVLSTYCSNGEEHDELIDGRMMEILPRLEPVNISLLSSFDLNPLNQIDQNNPQEIQMEQENQNGQPIVQTDSAFHSNMDINMNESYSEWNYQMNPQWNDQWNAQWDWNTQWNGQPVQFMQVTQVEGQFEGQVDGQVGAQGMEWNGTPMHEDLPDQSFNHDENPPSEYC